MFKIEEGAKAKPKCLSLPRTTSVSPNLSQIPSHDPLSTPGISDPFENPKFDEMYHSSLLLGLIYLGSRESV